MFTIQKMTSRKKHSLGKVKQNKGKNIFINTSNISISINRELLIQIKVMAKTKNIEVQI